MKKLLLTLGCLLILASNYSFAQCQAAISYSIQSTSPLVVLFNDSSSGTGPFSYQWDFGDGTFGVNANEVHTFPVDTIPYNVCLAITDGLGCTDSTCVMINNSVTPSVNISYFDVDSSSIFHCTAPADVLFYLYGGSQGFTPNDTLWCDISFGDGIDSTFYLMMGTSFWQGTVTHQYLNPGSYTTQLTVTAPNGMMDSSIAQTVTISSSCGPVSGTVYNDLNGNCINDAGDLPLEYITLQIYDGTNFMGWVSTDASGNYSFNVPAGPTYTIEVYSNYGFAGHFTPTCPATGTISATVPSSGNDFGLACPPGYDLQGSVTGWGFRPGFTGSVCVFAYNAFCNTPTGTIEIEFGTHLTPLPDTSATPAYTIVGSTVIYNISSPDLYWSFCIPVSVSTSAVIGDSACVTMTIQPIAGDSVPGNNTQSYCFEIRNSYDPNDKAVNPAGESSQGLIHPNTTMTYTIRFQNTGNAEAINIYILDTLDVSLDATSVELIATSHDVNMTLLTGNILRFNYDNIMLLDSNTNEPASHGYVTYRIHQVPNISHLTTITNTAYIYFDFNPPIVTNTTLNTVDHFLSVKPIDNSSFITNVYPNPSNDKCQLFFTDATEKTISVSDVLGKNVFYGSFASENYNLNTSKFADGVYTIQILQHGKTSSYKLVVSH
jgi:uncharacterized repeat protein (TIGR01451 family)